jgi:hypothetical protein
MTKSSSLPSLSSMTLSSSLPSMAKIALVPPISVVHLASVMQSPTGVLKSPFL